jgi:hypothetical protein
MSLQPNLSIVGFVPQQLVTVSVGRYQLNLYPKLSPGASLDKRTHAYQICKSALAAPNIDICVIFDALGLQLNCMATIDGLVYNFTRCTRMADLTQPISRSYRSTIAPGHASTTPPLPVIPPPFFLSSTGCSPIAASRTCALCTSKSVWTLRIFLAPGTSVQPSSN